MNLSDSISQIPGIGYAYAKKLEKLDIFSVKDLLYHIPLKYIDFSLVSDIGSIQEGEVVTVKGQISSINSVFIPGRKLTIQNAILKDNTGTVRLVWFNQPYLVDNLKDSNISAAGKVSKFRSYLTIESPEYEKIINHKSLHTGKLIPIYPETLGISSKWLRLKIDYILNNLNIVDPLPLHIITREKLIDLKSALLTLHQPQNQNIVPLARYRLSFDEVFYFQLTSKIRKNQWQQEKVGYKLSIEKNRDKINQLIKSLPFNLTSGQEKTLGEIYADLEKNTPMNRLLQGDVGSGKTVIGAICAYITYLNKLNTIFMAPTEILAQQHYRTFCNMLHKYGVRISLLTGSIKKNMSNANIFIGTHALLYNKKFIDRVGLVIIDEQHRFGVEQRAYLRKRQIHPHLLTMTATPIPRTIGLTLYAELDMSILDELPKGRMPVKTYVVTPIKQKAAYEWINKKIINSPRGLNQAYIIFPLIEESENLRDIKAATKEFTRLKKEVFPELRLEILHGKIKPKEKNHIIDKFHKGLLDILVATSVVEVGMDIPGATIMVIENADRFGLAQLHQLRGRVGRNDRQSYCLLFSDKPGSRLYALTKNYSGLKLAEIDSKIRGIGDIYGIKQHGRLALKIADITDHQLIEKARNQAIKLVETDPKLKEYPMLAGYIKPYLEMDVKPD